VCVFVCVYMHACLLAMRVRVRAAKDIYTHLCLCLSHTHTGSGVQFGVGQRCLLVKEGKKGWTLLLTGVSHVSTRCPTEQLSLLFVACGAHTHTQTHIRELSLTHTHTSELSHPLTHTHIRVYIHTLTWRWAASTQAHTAAK